MITLSEWAKLLEKSYSEDNISCPECKGKMVALLYAKKINDGKMGFAVLECEKCKARQEFSRVKFPDYVKTQEL